MIQVRCLRRMAPRNPPAIIEINFTDGALPLIENVPEIISEEAENMLTLMTVNMFLNAGGHEKTPEVLGAGISFCLRKLRKASPEVRVFLAYTIRRARSTKAKERSAKLKSMSTASGGIGCPGSLTVPE